MDALMANFSHPIVAIIILLGILVLVHEAGHYLVGKLCGIGVEIFSIGFGPVLTSFTRNGTQYRLSIIPLGGFVKFYGSVPGEELPPNITGSEFFKAKRWQRFLTIIAGPFANFLLAVLCYFGLGLHGIPHPPPLVGEIIEASPAQTAGLQFGDKVIKINDKDIKTWEDLHDIVFNSPGIPLTFLVENAGLLRKVTITPETEEDEFIVPGRKYGRIGISPGRVPSIVTVPHPESPAALSGLKTGDHIVGAFIGEKRTTIQYWYELDLILTREIEKGSSVLKLAVKRDSKKEDFVELVIGGLDKTDIGLAHSQLTIKKVGEFADKEKLQPFDQLLTFDGQPIKDIFSYAKIVSTYKKPTADLEVRRGGVVVPLNIALKGVDVQRAEGKVKQYVLPVEFSGTMIQPESVTEQYSFFGAIGFGVLETVKQTKFVAYAVYKLFTGEMPLAALGGPISIAKVASDSVKLGWMTFLGSMALISINLGLLNLLPIPVLDGGQLLLLGIEGVRRRPLSQGAIENFQKVGFVVVISLVIVATYNDFSRFWTDILKGFKGIMP